MHSCHWQLVNDTNAQLSLIWTQQSAFVSLTTGQWHSQKGPINTCLAPAYAFVSLTTGQWHKCTEFDLNPAICIRVIDHWSMTFPKGTHQHLSRYSLCIHVIDHRSMTFPKGTHQHLSRSSSCIRVIDNWSMTQMHWSWFKPSNLHSCHWPLVNDILKDPSEPTRGNYIEIPTEIHRKSSWKFNEILMLIHWKSSWNSIEISMEYQWKSIGNPVEISMKYHGNFQ